MTETVNHPAHYGGAENVYEAIKVIEAWGLGFCLGNAVKYISRAGKKPNASQIEDLKKARWYVERELQRLLAEYRDPNRCAVCGWPLGDEAAQCRRGDCSFRPRPPNLYDPERAAAEASGGCGNSGCFASYRGAEAQLESGQ